MANALDDFPLDIFGQQPSLNLYTQLSLCYPLEPTTADSVVISTLSQGLERLSECFPWVAGQVVRDGVYKIKPLEKTPRLVVKDLRDDPSISFSALREVNFPPSMLDEDIVAPRKTLTMLEPDAKDLPAFVAQANFVAGGLILTFVGHHQTMDLVGQVHIMSLLAKLCRQEAISAEDLSAGNINRRDVIPLLGPSYTPGPEVARLLPQASPPPEAVPTETPSSSSKVTWGSFLFSPSALSSLKSLASKSLPAECSFISTDDALSALIYRHVARARLARLSPTTPSRYTRAVDVRPYIPSIPPTYPGMGQTLVHFSQSLGSLAEELLGNLAAKVRAAVDPKTSSITYATLAMATLLDRADGKNLVGFTGPVNPTSDFMLSSWAKAGAYSLDYGFGLPEAVRRPQFTPYEGLCYLQPKRKDGEIAVMMSLLEEDLETLRADEEFVKFGKFIG